MTRFCLLIIGAGCLVGQLVWSPMDSPDDKQPNNCFAPGQVTSPSVTKSGPKTKPVQSMSNLNARNSTETSLALESNPIIDAEKVMSDSLTNLHLEQFSEYLSGELANEHTTLAFYTDRRWQSFYVHVGYQSDDINQLIHFRGQYLADSSQSGKEYYYHRWSDAPHRVLADVVAEDLLTYMRIGDDWELALSSSISDVARQYGVSRSLVENIARAHLLNSIGRIETSRALLDPKAPVIQYDTDFINFLNAQAKFKAGID